MYRNCQCHADDDCVCDQHGTINKYGYHLESADDSRSYWYALGVQTGTVPMTAAGTLDYDTAMAKRLLREYGYK